MRKILLGLGLFLGLYSFSFSGGYYKTYAVDYDSTTIKSDVVLKGNYYLVNSTAAVVDIVDNGSDPLSYADVAMESGGTYPLKLYNGDLQVVTTGYGITFPDGSLQTTAGVGSAFNTLSSTGTIVINSDSDASGDESIYFRTSGATNRMIIQGSDGLVGIGTITPSDELEIEYDISAGSTTESCITMSAPTTTLESKLGLFATAQVAGDYGWWQTITSGGTPFDSVINPLGGNVGVGITEPAGKLDVGGEIYLESSVYLDYDSVNYELDISTDVNINGKLILEDTDVLEYDASNYQIDVSTYLNIEGTKIKYVNGLLSNRIAGVPLLTTSFNIPYSDTKNYIESSVTVGGGPEGIAFDGTYMWVTNSSDDNVSKIDVTNDVVISSVTVGNDPEELAFDGTYMWVVNRLDDNVSKIDVTNDVVISSVTVGNSPIGIAFDGTYMWVANRLDDNVSKIDVTNDVVISSVTVGNEPAGIAFDGTYMWVTNSSDNNVSKIDVTNDVVISSVTVGNSPIGIAFDGTHMWVTNILGTSISKINVSEDVVSNTITITSPDNIFFDGEYMWVAANQYIYKIDINSNTILLYIDTPGTNPQQIFSDSSNIWVANETVGSVSKINR
jgi:YVTN family beta-propeller protein